MEAHQAPKLLVAGALALGALACAGAVEPTVQLDRLEMRFSVEGQAHGPAVTSGTWRGDTLAIIGLVGTGEQVDLVITEYHGRPGTFVLPNAGLTSKAFGAWNPGPGTSGVYSTRGGGDGIVSIMRQRCPNADWTEFAAEASGGESCELKGTFDFTGKDLLGESRHLSGDFVVFPVRN